MKKLIITLLLTSSFSFGFTQTWVKYLEYEQDITTSYTGITTEDGGILLHVTFYSSNGAYKNGVVKMNQDGEQVWFNDNIGRTYSPKWLQFDHNGAERFAFGCKKRRDSRTGQTSIGLSILDDTGKRLKVWSYKNTDKMSPSKLFIEDDELHIDVTSGDDFYKTERAFIHTDLNGKETGYSEQKLSPNFKTPSKQMIKNISLNLLYVPLETEAGLRLAKIENNKKVLWSTNPCVGVDSCRFGKILEFKKERFIASKGGRSIDIVKQDKKGNVLWSQNLPDAYTLCHWLRLDNGDLVVATMDTPRHSGKKSRLTKFNAAGKQLWQRIYTTENSTQIGGFYQTDDGGFLLVGSEKDTKDGKTKGLLIKTDEMGQTKPMDGQYEVVRLE